MNDTLLNRALFILGAVALLGLGGIIFLAATDHSIPDALVAIPSGAVTGVLGLLVNPGSRNQEEGL